MTITRESVRTTAGVIFPNEPAAEIVAILDGYGTAAHERERERVQQAVLQLSAGDRGRLLHYVSAAKQDYRDVLWWAENPDGAT